MNVKWTMEHLYVARNAQGVIVGVSDVKPPEYTEEVSNVSKGHLSASQIRARDRIDRINARKLELRRKFRP